MTATRRIETPDPTSVTGYTHQAVCDLCGWRGDPTDSYGAAEWEAGEHEMWSHVLVDDIEVTFDGSTPIYRKDQT